MPLLNVVEQSPPSPLPPFGLFGLSPVGLVSLPPVALPAPAGSTSISFGVPAQPALIGPTLYVQVGMVHSVSPFVARLTNVQADPITGL